MVSAVALSWFDLCCVIPLHFEAFVAGLGQELADISLIGHALCAMLFYRRNGVVHVFSLVFCDSREYMVHRYVSH